MLGEIILLTGEVEAPHLGDLLLTFNPALRIVHALTAKQLAEACVHPLPDGQVRRLIAFCTRVIVPRKILYELGGPAYNFHPGPPEYPGTHPASFAIYDGATRYGVTVHEMVALVDTGPIVAVKRFDILPSMRFADLEMHAYKALATVFSNLAKRLATDAKPLSHSGKEWSGTRSTKKLFEHMRHVTEDMDEEEIKRRFRAFG